jgi:hypothetical protein
MKIRSFGLTALAAALLFSISPALWAQDMYTALNNSNIRAQPTTQARILGLLRLGEKIKVTDAEGEWYQIELEDGRQAYIYAKLLQAPPEVTNREIVSEASQTDGGRSPAPDNAFLYIASPYDGEIIPGGQVWVRFGLRNMGVAPAGVNKQFTGHHHLLVNVDAVSMDDPIPSDDNHIHFGRGQTEYLLQLTPGTYTLQLVLGDAAHIPHDPPVVSKKITVLVPDS